MRSREDAIGIVGEVYNACNGLFSRGIQDAFLYGSYARGDFDEGSDVDILLTVDADPEELSRRRRDVSGVSSDLSLKHDVTVSVTVKPREQFYKYSEILPFYRNVLREGIRYEHNSPRRKRRELSTSIHPLN